ncbi:MAG TPA: hypothetical protein DDX39_03920 [Bacteroidales bacterium]|nr:MAG: hypothetical protein A2W98_09080 [Bacteroidetes bacterium GWF2_33_38]OFY74820.1 MAG: hypothetical protein A2265_06560 [Bacteroidetes bacterium RIFOXYA12_FULL_33_9]OFY88480.1 MAG: hypothetical protein A2236_10650 [Bacteroidetes bacterium RIFOXYA2_FULL_33_7]HBF87768.1 hypothetical protein [Bacteroidales bacterium]
MSVNFLIKSGIITFFFSCIFNSAIVAQQLDENLQIQSEPKAVVNYKTSPQINPLISQVNELAGGNDELTERVIFQIRQTKNTAIRRIVLDNEFETLSEELKKDAIKQSEVVEIINRLKK